MNKGFPKLPEPWLRGTLTDLPAVPRAVVHALQCAREDLWKWRFPLTKDQLNDRPAGIAPVAFHLRHIARSLDRLLTYAEGAPLNEEQLVSLKSELAPGARHAQLFTELEAALRAGGFVRRLLAILPHLVWWERNNCPTTLGGLLIHLAEHTQRHVGQAIITAKLVAPR